MVDAYEPAGSRQLEDLSPARSSASGSPASGSPVSGPSVSGPHASGQPASKPLEVSDPKTGSVGLDPVGAGTANSELTTETRPERAYLSLLLGQLANHVRREQLETWFRSLDVVRMDGQEIEFSVTSQFVRDWLQKNFLSPLQQAVAMVDRDGAGQENASQKSDNSGADKAGKRVVLSYREEDGWDSLRFAKLDGDPSESGSGSDTGRSTRAWGPGSIGSGLDGVIDPIRRHLHSEEVGGVSSRGVPAAAAHAQPISPGVAVTPRKAGPRLNPNYTFDKFVVGACNRLGHASSIAIAENPGFAYNPLFVHGNVGLGKSHLLQAICHTIVKRSPDARVIYMSCEDFTNAFIQAIQSKQVEAFRNYYRDADVLVIDDVQFLAHKDKTQDEFFHTFNALYDAQKQIVLSSDRPPVEIPTIEERLVSRFKWGLVAEVEAPCFETRKAIVQRKAMGRGTELPEDVARFLAERVATNIRELEGAVIKVVGIAAITGQPITLGLAETCMRGLPVRNGQVSADDIMTLITSEFAISARELTGKSRTQMVSLPRQVAMYLIREHTENSLEDVGRIFGGRDHTTVLYAVNKIKERLGRDRTFKDLIESLSNRLLTRGFR